MYFFSSHKGIISNTLATPTYYSRSLGPPFVLLHVGGENGLIPCAGPTFFYKRNPARVHNEMDGSTCKNWFINKLFPMFSQNSTLALNNV